uniref:Varsurf_PPLC domain-containing protein n=1 Tax=Rhodnius prolixus TaxID=13249 RepID=T1HBM1_RHOPR
MREVNALANNLKDEGLISEIVSMPPLYLTVSALFKDSSIGSALIDREIDIYWVDDSFDKIALFDSSPSEEIQPILQFNTKQYPERYVHTNITLGNPKFPGSWNYGSSEIPVSGDHCLHKWIAGIKNNTISYIDCIKIRPTWMQDNRLSIGNLAVTSLFLPGTHNSGCYKRGETLSQKDASGRYILTQDQTIWNQLVYGIRYLDFRIGYYPSKKNVSESDHSCFWINHDLIKVRPLVPVIQQLKEYLEKAKDEIVIIDFHRFPLGFSGRIARHVQLVDYLELELKEYAISYSNETLTLNDIWDTNKRLIISYGDKSIAREHEWLWPPIRQLWGNKQNLDKLYEYLEYCMSNETIRDPKKGMWAAMAQLTPGPLDLLFNPTGSLRHMAHIVNRNLTSWCRNNWWNKANIIAADFFLETDIINIAVASNIMKGNSPNHYLID